MNTAPASTQTGIWRERLGALRWTSLSLLIIVLDQITKALVVAKIELQYGNITLLPVLDLVHMQNTGAAFSFLAGASGWQRWLFVGLAAVVAVAILIWLKQIQPRSQRLLAVGLALILGGALGNVIDRLWLGYVIDFVHVHWGERYFPAFNVADSSITIGAALLIIDALLDGRRAKAAAKQARIDPNTPAGPAP